MRDGIKLAADICLPKKLEKDKKIPTILYFLPDM
jgi:predicted acyl esterase